MRRCKSKFNTMVFKRSASHKLNIPNENADVKVDRKALEEDIQSHPLFHCLNTKAARVKNVHSTFKGR